MIVIDEKLKELIYLPSTREQVDFYTLDQISEVIERIAAGELKTLGQANMQMNAFLSHSAVRLAENFRANKQKDA